MKKTIDFALGSDLDTFQVNIFTPLPGCELYDEVSKYGRFDNDWEKMNLLNVLFIPDGLTKRGLEKYAFQARRRFYLRPKVIWNHVKYMRKPKDFLNFYKAVYAFTKANVKERIREYRSKGLTA